MWFTCHNCNGTGVRETRGVGQIIEECSVCSLYNIYIDDILTIYGHIWCEDEIQPITPPSSPRIINE